MATVVRKAADEQVASSTLQNDDELVLAIGAAEVWIIHYYLLLDLGSATPDFKATISIPSGTAKGMTSTAAALANIMAHDYAGAAGTTLTAALTSGQLCGMVMYWIVKNGATAGDVTLRWAQNVNTPATNTKVLADSFLVAWQAP